VKKIASLLLFCFVANFAFAQGGIDSLQQKTNQVALPQMPDSLKASWQKVDSIRHDFNAEADSLKQSYQSALAPIESAQNKLNHQVDSLNNLGLPSNGVTRKLDSLKQEKTKLETDLNGKLDQVKTKTIGKLDKIEMTPEMQGPVNEFTQKIKGFNVTDNSLTQIAPIDVPGYSLPEIKGIDGLPDMKGLGNLSDIKTPLGDVSDVSKQVGGLGEDVKNISQGNLNDVQQIPQTIEQQATRIDGMEEIQKSTQAIDGYKDQLDMLKSEDALKQQGQDMVKKEAINHFAGKEKELQAAMDKLSKIKQKYGSVQSIRDLPKRPPNAMKGKPFVERLVPGIWLQFQLRDNWLVDFNPYAGYKISGRFVAGLGWNQRFSYDNKQRHFVSKNRVYGPRVFVNCKLGRGFIAHLEQEAMNTFVPYKITGNPNEGNCEWVWSTMLGMKKTYRIYKNLNGTVLINYNIYNPHFRAPYLDKLSSRMGFEYVLKKRKKPAAEKQN
jgi:hypothetical protein